MERCRICLFLTENTQHYNLTTKDIKSFGEGEHCFGQILEINDEDVYKMDVSELKEFINDMINNNINSESLITELTKVALQYLQFNTIEKERENEICEQCGGWNFYTKWTE